jgi:hypothetical protein
VKLKLTQELADGLAAAMREHVQRELAPLREHAAAAGARAEAAHARLAELEAKLAEIESKSLRRVA